MDQVLDKLLPALMPILQFVGVSAVIGIVIWYGTEGLAKAFKKWLANKKRWVKFGLGIFLGLAAYGSGWMTVPTPGAWGWVMSALVGWLCAFGVGVIHDRKVKRG